MKLRRGLRKAKFTFLGKCLASTKDDVIFNCKFKTLIKKTVMSRLNRTAKLAFYKARRRQGDTTRLAEATGFTTRFINYVLAGERKVNDTLADAMYSLSRRRVKGAATA